MHFCAAPNGPNVSVCKVNGSMAPGADGCSVATKLWGFMGRLRQVLKYENISPKAIQCSTLTVISSHKKGALKGSLEFVQGTMQAL